MKKEEEKQIHKDYSPIMQSNFDDWNIQKFEGKLPKYKVLIVGHLKSSIGKVFFTKKVIKLNSKYTYDTLCNTLLHEMTHAEIYRRKLGRGHNKAFWRLFVQVGGVIQPHNKQLFKKAQYVANEKVKQMEESSIEFNKLLEEKHSIVRKLEQEATTELTEKLSAINAQIKNANNKKLEELYGKVEELQEYKVRIETSEEKPTVRNKSAIKLRREAWQLFVEARELAKNIREEIKNNKKVKQ